MNIGNESRCGPTSQTRADLDRNRMHGICTARECWLLIRPMNDPAHVAASHLTFASRARPHHYRVRPNNWRPRTHWALFGLKSLQKREKKSLLRGADLFVTGTRGYASRTRSRGRRRRADCRDLTGTRRTHVAVCPSNSDADRSTCWAVRCTPKCTFQQDSAPDAKDGWMDAAEGRWSTCRRHCAHVKEASRSRPASTARSARSSWTRRPYGQRTVSVQESGHCGVVWRARSHMGVEIALLLLCMCMYGPALVHVLRIHAPGGHCGQYS